MLVTRNADYGVTKSATEYAVTTIKTVSNTITTVMLNALFNYEWFQ